MARMKRLQFMLEPELDVALEQAALREGVSKAALLRRWVRLNVVPLPPLEEDPLWGMLGAYEGEPGEIDEVVYGRKA